MMFDGETALVTGAASNIGRALAVALAERGAHVVASDVHLGELEKTASLIRQAGGSVTPVECDLATRTGWLQLLEAAGPGALQMFVHSACPPRVETATVDVVDEDEFDRMINVNLRSGFFLARGIAEKMKQGGVAGRVLFVTSLHDHTPRNLPHYSASKAGLEAIMKEMARHYGPSGIRVNALAPGAFPGGGVDLDAAAGKSLTQKVPMRRFGTDRDIAGPAIALLDNDQSAYVTGTTLVADGGLSHFNWIQYPPSTDTT